MLLSLYSVPLSWDTWLSNRHHHETCRGCDLGRSPALSPPVDVIYLISAQDGLYRKELFSVHARFEGDSDRFPDPWGGELRGYTEKM